MKSVADQRSRNVDDASGSAAPLDIITLEQLGAQDLMRTLVSDYSRQSPGKTERVGDSGVETLASINRVDVGSIASQNDTPIPTPRHESSC